MRAFRLPCQVLVIVLVASTFAAGSVRAQTLYVDDDAANDPGPNDPSVSDPLEDGSPAHPFDSVQEAIDHAGMPCDVRILAGHYVGSLSFPYAGCSIVGSGSANTTLDGTNGTLLSAYLYDDPPISARLDIRAVSMSNGSLYVEATVNQPHQYVIRLADAHFESVPMSLWLRWSAGNVLLSSLTMTNSSVWYSQSESVDPLFELDTIDMLGGGIGAGNIGSLGFVRARLLNAPSSTFILDRTSGGRQHFELTDSTIGGFWDTMDGSSGGSTVIVDNVHFTSTGITADNGEGGHSMSISNSVFEHGGVEVTNVPDWDGNPQTSIAISRCVFRESGVSMTSNLTTFEPPGGPYPPYGANLSLSVMHSTFHGDGIDCETRASTGDVGRVELSVANNLFENVTEGVRISVVFPDEDPLWPTSTSVRNTIVNNTIATTGAGVRISTNPHIGPAGSATTMVKNNILAGGSLGVEVSGTVGHYFQFEANDVWSATGANWVGDVSDQTGQYGNISAEPQFANLAAGNYRLTVDSPCVDAGASGIEVPSDDFEGTSRPLDGDLDGRRIVDIGAFEFAPDADGDGRNVGSDCDDHNQFAWEAPGEVLNLAFSDTSNLDWEAPIPAGGVFVFYDSLRTAGPTGFLTTAVCIESNDALDSRAFDAGLPAPNAAFYYLVRAENLCSPGQGPLGFRSDGASIPGRACP